MLAKPNMALGRLCGCDNEGGKEASFLPDPCELKEGSDGRDAGGRKGRCPLS